MKNLFKACLLSASFFACNNMSNMKNFEFKSYKKNRNDLKDFYKYPKTTYFVNKKAAFVILNKEEFEILKKFNRVNNSYYKEPFMVHTLNTSYKQTSYCSNFSPIYKFTNITKNRNILTDESFSGDNYALLKVDPGYDIDKETIKNQLNRIFELFKNSNKNKANLQIKNFSIDQKNIRTELKKEQDSQKKNYDNGKVLKKTLVIGKWFGIAALYLLGLLVCPPLGIGIGVSTVCALPFGFLFMMGCIMQEEKKSFKDSCRELMNGIKNLFRKSKTKKTPKKKIQTKGKSNYQKSKYSNKNTK